MAEWLVSRSLNMESMVQTPAMVVVVFLFYLFVCFGFLSPLTHPLHCHPKFGAKIVSLGQAQKHFFKFLSLFSYFSSARSISPPEKRTTDLKFTFFSLFTNSKDFISREYIGIHMNYDPNYHIATVKKSQEDHHSVSSAFANPKSHEFTSPS